MTTNRLHNHKETNKVDKLTRVIRGTYIDFRVQFIYNKDTNMRYCRFLYPNDRNKEGEYYENTNFEVCKKVFCSVTFGNHGVANMGWS